MYSSTKMIARVQDCVGIGHFSIVTNLAQILLETSGVNLEFKSASPLSSTKWTLLYQCSSLGDITMLLYQYYLPTLHKQLRTY